MNSFFWLSLGIVVGFVLGLLAARWAVRPEVEKLSRMARHVSRLLVFTLPALLLSSCVIMHERDGEGKSATYASLGGKGAYRKGVGVIHNHEKSFRDGAILMGTMATSYFGAAATQATEATNQIALKEATKKHASDNALKKTAIEANAAAHGQAISAEVPGLVPAAPPPAITP